MAMFYKNICQFGQCSLEFANVYDLIQHIEETHIPLEAEKKPDTQSQVACAPLSAICRYYQRLPDQPARPIIPKATFQQPSPHIPGQTGVSAAVKKRIPAIIAQQSVGSPAGGPNALVAAGGHNVSHMTGGQASSLFHPPSNVVMARSAVATPASHVSEEDESMSVGRESFSSESSMALEENTGDPGAMYKIVSPTGNDERRYVCTVPGCKKSYKNMNGIRYHAKITHMNAGGPTAVQPNAKKFKCQCGKAYKTSHGLHNHMLQTHHRQATPSAPAPSATVAAGVAAGIKFSTGVTGVSASPSQGQYKRGLALSMLGGSGPSAGAPTAGMVKHVPQGPSGSLTTSYYAQQSSMKGGAVGGGSSTTTLPSGVSVQVSNVGGGAPTTVQVGQQGALGVVASTVAVATGPPSGHGLHVSAGRRLSTIHHAQQHLHAMGGRPLKIHSAALSGNTNVVVTSAPFAPIGVSAYNANASVTTMGGSNGK